jgi:S-DNA-T family DNA segregation ATPase FtsK/SpoIIIE
MGHFPMILGRRKLGGDLIVDLADPWHWIEQGMSRSGKTVLAYNVLAQVACHRDVAVAGVDPTGVLLGPWAEHPYDEWRANGGADLEAHVRVLRLIVAEMDRRISTYLGRATRLDKLDVEHFTADLPLILVVLEEYPGELKQLRDFDSAQDRKRGERLEPTARAAVGRLVAEGAKAGIRVLLLAQRADAEFIDGASRSNFGARVSFRVDNADAVRMLFEQATPEQIEEITTLPQGIGVSSLPGPALEFFKGDYVTYEQYCDVIERHAKRAGEASRTGEDRPKAAAEPGGSPSRLDYVCHTVITSRKAVDKC